LFGGEDQTMKRVSLLVMTMVVCLLISCRDVRDTELSKLNEEQSKALDKKLNGEETRLLMGYMMRQGMSQAFGGKGAPDGITARQAIQEQREFLEKEKQEEAKAEELKKKVEAERKAKHEEFARLLSSAVVRKQNVDSEYGQKYVAMEMAFENKSDRDIEGVKGVLKIADIFGDPINNIRFSYDGGVPAGRTATYKGQIDINRFIDKDMKLWNTDFEKLKMTFDISAVIYKDGTKIEAPPSD
jgi:hypothetical protein